MADPVDLEAFRKSKGPSGPDQTPPDDTPRAHEYQFNLSNGTSYQQTGVLFVTGNFVMLMDPSGVPTYLAPVASLVDVINISPIVPTVSFTPDSDLIGVSFIEGLDDEE